MGEIICLPVIRESVEGGEAMVSALLRPQVSGRFVVLFLRRGEAEDRRGFV